MSKLTYQSGSLSLLLVVCLFVLDYVTHISIYPLYLIPIFLLSKINLDLGWISVPLFALFSIFLDYHTQLDIVSLELLYLALFRYLILFILSYLLISFSRSIDNARARYDRLKQLLPICPECGSLLCPDQQWRSLDYLLTNPDLFKTPIHSECLVKQPAKLDYLARQ